MYDKELVAPDVKMHTMDYLKLVYYAARKK